MMPVVQALATGEVDHPPFAPDHSLVRADLGHFRPEAMAVRVSRNRTR